MGEGKEPLPLHAVPAGGKEALLDSGVVMRIFMTATLCTEGKEKSDTVGFVLFLFPIILPLLSSLNNLSVFKLYFTE